MQEGKTYGHAGKLMEVLRDDPEKRNQIEKQLKGETPVFFKGYVQAENVDVLNQLKACRQEEHGLLLIGMKDHFGSTPTYEGNSPVAAWMFSPEKFVEELAKKAGAKISPDQNTVSQLAEEMLSDLEKMGVHSVEEVNSTEVGGKTKTTAFVGVPITQPVKNAAGDDYTFVKDDVGIDTLIAYLMTKKHNGKPLATLEEIMEVRNYGHLMYEQGPNIINPENIKDKKLQEDFKVAYEEALRNEPEAATRILAYHMALHHITPEVVEQRYGAETLEKATSLHTENWLRSLTGKAPIEGKWTRQYTSEIDHREHGEPQAEQHSDQARGPAITAPTALNPIDTGLFSSAKLFLR